MSEHIKQNKYKKYSFIVTVFLVYFIILTLNFYTPLIADDFQYYFKTESFKTILADEYLQYMTWTGRSVVHVLARIFLLLPKGAFNFINSFAYIAVTYFIYKITTQKELQIFKYLLIHMLLWVFLPAYGEVILWVTGSANYLWGSLIILGFILFYHSYYMNFYECLLLKRYSIVIVFIIGVAAGWCNENTSGGALLIIIGYMLLMLIEKRKIPKWMYSGVAGMISGLILMVSAPGNDIRSSYFERNNWSMIAKIKQGFTTITTDLISESIVLFIMAIILYLLSLHRERQ